MKTRVAIHLLFLLSVIFLTADLHADWSSDWKQTVAAAKKEGRLNLYVGRYGQAALLDEFKKDYPEQSRLGQRHRRSARHPNRRGDARRENHRRHLQRRAQLEL